MPALDASAEGREVYKRLGFRDVGHSTNFTGTVGDDDRESAADIAPLTRSDLAEVAAFDALSSGTDRTILLGHLLQRHPSAARVARQNGRVVGFVMARPGRLSTQIGPLLAESEQMAIRLLSQAASAVGGPICLDLFDQHVGLRGWLEQRRFKIATRFVRMVLSDREIFPHDHKVYIIAGPELG